jgi:acyl carrier protein
MQRLPHQPSGGWFRTGDLGYMDQEGYLFVVGRTKEADVINRGGQKVAPAEVEEALRGHPEVIKAVAFPISHRRLGEDVAAAVVLRPEAKVSAHGLRRFVATRLAAFKVPGSIQIVPEIPSDASGRINRAFIAANSTTLSKVLERPDGKRPAPRSLLESQLAERLAELLELHHVAVDQNIFELGADSLTVTQMLSRLRACFGIDLSFKDIFDAPNVAALAARLELSQRYLSKKKNALGLSNSLRDAPTDARHAPLSFQQQRIHILSSIDPTGYNYHIIEAARFLGPLDLDALEASISAICERHEVLRSTFVERLGELTQTIGSACPRLEHVDLSPCGKSRREAVIQTHAQKWLSEPFIFKAQHRLTAAAADTPRTMCRGQLHHHATVARPTVFWEESRHAIGVAKARSLPKSANFRPVQAFREWHEHGCEPTLRNN